MSRKQNLFDVIPLYRRACTLNLSLHLLVMIALLPQLSYTYSLLLWIKVNASKTARINPFCYRKYGEPSIIARNNTTFTIRCLTLLFVSNVTTWTLNVSKHILECMRRNLNYRCCSIPLCPYSLSHFPISISCLFFSYLCIAVVFLSENYAVVVFFFFKLLVIVCRSFVFLNFSYCVFLHIDFHIEPIRPKKKICVFPVTSKKN